LTTALFVFLLVAIGLLNIIATLAVRRDEYSEPLQKALQILLVWLVPILGALLVLAVHRKPEKASGRYRSGSDPVGDDFGTQRPGVVRSITDMLDDD